MVRYADGPTTWCEVSVPAAPADVWRLATDIEVPARFSPELFAVRWLDGAAGAALGALFEGHNRHARLGEWRTISRVVELDPPHTYAWAVVDPDDRFGGDTPHPMATWRFELSADAAGTQLRHGVRIGPARSGLSLAIDRDPDAEEAIVEYRLGRLRAGMRATLDGIAAAFG